LNPLSKSVLPNGHKNSTVKIDQRYEGDDVEEDNREGGRDLKYDENSWIAYLVLGMIP
jgi:hypothetical protein